MKNIPNMNFRLRNKLALVTESTAGIEFACSHLASATNGRALGVAGGVLKSPL
jgi:hypothetical protein